MEELKCNYNTTMINTLLSGLMKRYDPADQELYLKAKFVLIFSFLVILALTVILIYTSFIGDFNRKVLLPELTGYFIIFLALILLKRGYYIPAIHTILISGFTVTWTVLFIDSDGTLIMKTDTIVFVIALLTAMPLMLFRSRLPMVVYFAVNFCIFIYFTYYLGDRGLLTDLETLEYFLDNAIVMLFVFFISFNLYSIYNQVLRTLRKELQERKKAEHSLGRLQVLLGNIINSMPSILIGTDREEVVNQWNREAERVSGIPPEEAKGRRISDVFPQISRLSGNIKQVISKGEVLKVERVAFTYQGKEQLYDITIYPLIDESIDGAVIRIDDISERVKMEEVMMQSEKMLTVGGLAAGMAHEINNPLAGMIQNAQVVLNRLSKNQPANLRAAEESGIEIGSLNAYMQKRKIIEMLQYIVSSGKRAAQIVERMLNFSRKSTSNFKYNDITQVIDRAVEMAGSDYDFTKKYDFRNIRIIREYGEDVPEVYCEATQIEHVVLNLLINAAQTLVEKQFSSGEEPKIILRTFSKKDFVYFEIEDNGTGMKPEVIRRVFEPFYTTKELGKGTGLGLFVAYYIITGNHDGTMSANSVPGEKTSISFAIPVNRQEK